MSRAVETFLSFAKGNANCLLPAELASRLSLPANFPADSGRHLASLGIPFTRGVVALAQQHAASLVPRPNRRARNGAERKRGDPTERNRYTFIEQSQ
jgi:hypothetical protein